MTAAKTVTVAVIMAVPSTNAVAVIMAVPSTNAVAVIMANACLMENYT